MTVSINPPPIYSASPLSRRLRALARQRGPNAKMPTVREICSLFDTNWAAIDTALRQLEQESIIYRRQGSGIFVSPHVRRRLIAVLLNAEFFRTPGASPFWGMLWGACADEAQGRAQKRDEAYEFRIIHPGFEEDAQIFDHAAADLEAERLHGCVALGLPCGQVNRDVIRRLPLVTYAGDGFWKVRSDVNGPYPQGIADLAAKGCRRIGLWGPTDFQRFAPHPGSPVDPDFLHWCAEVRQNFKAQCREVQTPYLDDLLVDGVRMAQAYHSQPSRYEHFCAQTYQDQGHAAVLEIFSRPRVQWPDGLYIADDMMTLGTLAAFDKLNVRVGRDVHLCSHSNAGSIVLYGKGDQLARVETDPLEVAHALFELLDCLLEGREPQAQVTTVPTRYYPV